MYSYVYFYFSPLFANTLLNNTIMERSKIPHSDAKLDKMD